MTFENTAFYFCFKSVLWFHNKYQGNLYDACCVHWLPFILIRTNEHITCFSEKTSEFLVRALWKHCPLHLFQVCAVYFTKASRHFVGNGFCALASIRSYLDESEYHLYSTENYWIPGTCPFKTLHFGSISRVCCDFTTSIKAICKRRVVCIGFHSF